MADDLLTLFYHSDDVSPTSELKCCKSVW